MNSTNLAPKRNESSLEPPRPLSHKKEHGESTPEVRDTVMSPGTSHYHTVWSRREQLSHLCSKPAGSNTNDDELPSFVLPLAKTRKSPPL